MKFHVFGKERSFDAYVIPCVQDKKSGFLCLATLSKEAKRLVEEARALHDFSAKKTETFCFYNKLSISPRVILLGLGEERELNGEVLREAYGALFAKLGKMKLSTLLAPCPTIRTVRSSIVLMSMMEGMSYGAYRFSKYKKHEISFPDVWIETQDTKEFTKANQRVSVLMKYLALVRDLVNMNACDIHPQGFAEEVVRHAPKGVSIEIHDEKWIEKERMGLLLGVGQGSPTPPRFMTISWKPKTASKEHTVLIGKGVTFDSGGLNLKPTGSIETMRDDMSGAAAVAGTVFALAELKAPVHVTAVMPLAENSIGSFSFKPGDILTARSGDTVEITNTDAEGRLLLADAVDWAISKLAPTRIVDVATLTGACERALGPDMTGLFSNSDELACELTSAAQRAGEIFFRFPLHKPYRELLLSEVADLKNSSGSLYGGAITGALFIEHFAKNTPWAHLDIAGTSFHKDGRTYYGKGATGTPVRALLELLLPGYE